MMRSLLSILLFLLSVSAVPAVIESQASPLSVGARIRVTSPQDNLRKHVTTVTEVRGDSIVVAGRSGVRTIGLDNITSLEVSTGTRNRVARDGLIGAGVGALVGLAFASGVTDECDPFFESGCSGALDHEFAGLSMAIFGTAGLLTGSVIGLFDRTDRWEARKVPARAAISPARSGGVQLSLSVSF